MRQKKNGIILSYLTIIVNMLISIILTPYILNLLGASEYGLYKIVNSFIGSLHLVNIGAGIVIARYVAVFTLNDEKKKQSDFLGMMSIVTIVVTGIVAILGVALYNLIEPFYKNTLSLHEIQQAKTMCIIAISQIVVIIVSSSFSGIITGYEKFTFSFTMNFFKVILRPILIIILFQLRINAMMLIIADFLCVLIIFLFELLYCFIKLKIKITFNKFDSAILKTTLSFAVANILQAFVNQVNQSVDTVILGMFEGTEIVALYSIALNFFVMFSGFSNVVGCVFLPKISKMVALGSTNDKITDVATSAGRYQFIISGGAFFGFLLYGRSFIELWVGKQYLPAYIVAVILILPLVVTSVQTVYPSIMDAMLKRLVRSIIIACVAIINIVFTIVMVKHIGYIGAAIGTSLAFIIGHIIILNIYYYKYIGLDVVRGFKEIFKGILPTLIVVTLINLPMEILLNNTWFTFVIKCLVFCIVYFFTLMKFGLKKEEKNFILKTLHLK